MGSVAGVEWVWVSSMHMATGFVKGAAPHRVVQNLCPATLAAPPPPPPPPSFTTSLRLLAAPPLVQQRRLHRTQKSVRPETCPRSIVPSSPTQPWFYYKDALAR
eukprot:5669643-Pyramimonas_sp.AAC.1